MMSRSIDYSPRPTAADDAKRYVEEGYWQNESLGAVLAAGLHDAAEHPFTVYSARKPYRGTLRDVDVLARHVARGLPRAWHRSGGRRRVPTPELARSGRNVLRRGLSRCRRRAHRALLRPKEVGYILRKTNVKALVTADRFGHQDFLANLAVLRGDLPGLVWVAVVGDRTEASLGAGDVAFADLVSSEPLAEIPAVDPGAPALVAYTSGTTSDPKGVVHSHRTITAEIQQLAAMQANRGGPTMITGAPVGHGIGMLAALLVPVYNRTGGFSGRHSGLKAGRSTGRC